MDTPQEALDPKKDVIDLASNAIGKLSDPKAGEIPQVAGPMGKLANMGTSWVLLVFGGAMIVFSVKMKLASTIRPTEFISMIALGVLLVLAGAAFESYRYRREMDAYQEKVRQTQIKQNQLGEIARTSLKTVAEISKATTPVSW